MRQEGIYAVPSTDPESTLDPAASLWDLAAATLDRLRIDRSLSHSALAKLLGVHRSTVARILSGESKLQERHARTVDDKWRLNGLVAAHVHHATTQHDTTWTRQRRTLQRKASALLIWELAWVPGIFQTRDYARATFIGAGFGEPEIERGVEGRIEDQAPLDSPKPPAIRCLLDQGVIEQPVGGAAVMREQLARLAELSYLHTIRIMPRSKGAHIGRDGTWWIMTVDGRKVAYTEAMGPGRLIRDLSDVDWYERSFNQLSDDALSREESRRLIETVMEGFG
jgi:transcriptional regulator with XRE-family HTH domain